MLDRFLGSFDTLFDRIPVRARGALIIAWSFAAVMVTTQFVATLKVAWKTSATSYSPYWVVPFAYFAVMAFLMWLAAMWVSHWREADHLKRRSCIRVVKN